MATAPPASKFAPADLVKYRNTGEYIILSISNEIGFNRYHLLNIENGQEQMANTFELEKIPVDILEITEDEFETKPEKKRFKTIQPEELDNLSKKTTEPTTDRQTSWAVKIFKGIYLSIWVIS
jgi:hypothetical protein